MPTGANKDSHLDLMLESGDGLRTWSIAKFPVTGEVSPAEELPIHRLAYLDYEGPVSNNRGEVSRVDSGTYEIQSSTEDGLTILLQGQTYHGTVQLTRENEKSWNMTFNV